MNYYSFLHVPSPELSRPLFSGSLLVRVFPLTSHWTHRHRHGQERVSCLLSSIRSVLALMLMMIIMMMLMMMMMMMKMMMMMMMLLVRVPGDGWSVERQDQCPVLLPLPAPGLLQAAGPPSPGVQSLQLWSDGLWRRDRGVQHLLPHSDWRDLGGDPPPPPPQGQAHQLDGG